MMAWISYRVRLPALLRFLTGAGSWCLLMSMLPAPALATPTVTPTATPTVTPPAVPRSDARPAAVALDVGHSLARLGATSSRGEGEFHFNARLVDDLTRALGRLQLPVWQIGRDGRADALSARARAADGAALLLSVHHDSVQPRFLSAGAVIDPETYRGFSLFVSRKNAAPQASLACASRIGAALLRAGYRPSRYHAAPIPGENRPWADYEHGVHYFDDLVVLKQASIPAVLLEAAVIVNPQEESRMLSAVQRAHQAEVVAQAVAGCIAR